MKLKYGSVVRKYPVKCRGVHAIGRPPLTKPITVDVCISKSHGSNFLRVSPNCPYNVGGHGQRCKASHQNIDKLGEGWDILCIYSCDLQIAVGGGITGYDEDLNEHVILAKDGTITYWEGSPAILVPRLRKLVKGFLEEIIEK